MRALEIVQQRLRSRLGFLHEARWRALWRTVHALIVGKKLWLTAIGRSLPTTARPKHAIKAVDRLLGNRHLHRERFSIAAALADMLIPTGGQPILLIDTVEVRHRLVAITAALAYDGRAFPLWSTRVSHYKPKIRDVRRFLDELARILPEGCSPVLVTDAGFETPWLLEVEAHGWDYISRLRGMTQVLFQGEWIGLKKLRSFATNRPKNLGVLTMVRSRRHARRVVMSKLPVCHHRQVATRRGPGRGTNYHVYRQNAHEPLVLTTSLTSNAHDVVRLYRLRMQIEQSFRDLKNHRWGWSLRHCLTRSRQRLEVLFLIAAIALLVQQTVGAAAEHLGLHRHHQANTVRRRRVLSHFVLGGLVITHVRPDESPDRRSILFAFRTLASKIECLYPITQ